MKTKPGNPRPERLLKATHSVSALLRKKKPKRLTPKKSVRFSLMAKLSSSELLLSRSRLVDSLKPDFEQGGELKSHSCENLAAARPSYQRSFPCLLSQSLPQQKMLCRLSKSKSLDKYFCCFNDLYLLGPVLNLQRKVPAKGILKSLQGCDHFTNSLGTCMSYENDLSVKDSLLTLAHKRGSYSYRHGNGSLAYGQPASPFTSVPNQNNTFDNLTASIQGLHISSQSQGDQAHRGNTGQPCWNFCQTQPFISYFPQNSLPVESKHSIVSFLDVDAGRNMSHSDINSNAF